jgi:hypothetical protein
MRQDKIYVFSYCFFINNDRISSCFGIGHLGESILNFYTKRRKTIDKIFDYAIIGQQ